VQTVPITTNVVSSNSVHGEVYSIQHYVIHLSVTCDRSVVFSGYSGFNKTDHHDMTEILLKVALNTINQQAIAHIQRHYKDGW
jgi:isocitrate dehydrogenase